MKIHHSQLRQAERLGFTLDVHTVGETNYIKITHNETKRSAYGMSPSEALIQGTAMLKVLARYPNHTVESPDNPRMVYLINEGRKLDIPATTYSGILLEMDAPWVDYRGEDSPDYLGQYNQDKISSIDEFEDPVRIVEVERKNGVPIDGAAAYREGIPAADNPFNNESEDEAEKNAAEKWYSDWDEAADANEEEKTTQGGSVVNGKYRTIYAERGHPNHCGDWLAVVLNEQCLTTPTFNIARFEEICDLNGVSLAKYDRTRPGWSGRLRMTGRNLLARRVFLNEGTLVLSNQLTLVAPSEWMAAQKFAKVKNVAKKDA